MDEEQSFKSNSDTDDDASGLFKIGNILSIQTIEKAAVRSREKYLNRSIQKLQDNVGFHEELLTVQNSNILDHECLEQLDYIFNQSLVSNRTQLELALDDNITTKRGNIAKLSRDFADQRNALSGKYEQLRERKLTRCALHTRIVAGEKALQSAKVLLKSLDDKMLTTKLDIQRTNDRNMRLGQEAIVKFATMMHVRNRENQLRKQLAKNAEIKKRLEEEIKELQWRHMGKEMRNYEAQIASHSGHGIAQKLLLSASLPRASNNAVKLVSSQSQSSELHITTVRTQKTSKYSKSDHKPNASFSKMNASFTNNIIYSNQPLLKKHKSANMAATISKYFQSSRTYLKSFGKKCPRSTDASSTTLGGAINDDKADKAFRYDTHAPNNNLGKRVKFSSELLKETSYVSDAPLKVNQQPDTATKIEVINIIREDIVRSSIQAKTTTTSPPPPPIAVSQEKIKNAQIIEHPMEVYDDEYDSNFAYLDSGTQYLGQDEDVTPIETAETDGDSNKYSKEEMDVEGQDMFSFGRI